MFGGNRLSHYLSTVVLFTDNNLLVIPSDVQIFTQPHIYLTEKPLPDTIGIVVAHKTQICVYTPLKML